MIPREMRAWLRTRNRAAAVRVAMTVAVAGTACVQKAYDRTVVYRVQVAADSAPRVVGLRGRTAPLSWDTDLVLQPVRDSVGLYEAVVTHHTGSLVTEVKFTVNGTFELENQDNRTVRWAPTTVGNDTIVYRARFNTR